MGNVSNMQEALEWLIDVLDTGIEFPDAAHAAATKFDVDQMELEGAYDAWCAEGE